MWGGRVERLAMLARTDRWNCAVHWPPYKMNSAHKCIPSDGGVFPSGGKGNLRGGHRYLTSRSNEVRGDGSVEVNSSSLEKGAKDTENERWKPFTSDNQKSKVTEKTHWSSTPIWQVTSEKQFQFLVSENPLQHIWVQVAYNSFVLQATKGDGVKFVQFNFSKKKKGFIGYQTNGKIHCYFKIKIKNCLELYFTRSNPGDPSPFSPENDEIKTIRYHGRTPSCYICQRALSLYFQSR